MESEYLLFHLARFDGCEMFLPINVNVSAPLKWSGSFFVIRPLHIDSNILDRAFRNGHRRHFWDFSCFWNCSENLYAGVRKSGKLLLPLKSSDDISLNPQFLNMLDVLMNAPVNPRWIKSASELNISTAFKCADVLLSLQFITPRLRH